MKRFEYKKIELRFNSGKSFIDILNEEGEEGWEYVEKEDLSEKVGSNVPYYNITGVKILFKREKQ